MPEEAIRLAGIAMGDRLEILPSAGTIVIRKLEAGGKQFKAAGILSDYSGPALKEKEKYAYKTAMAEKWKC